MIAYLWFRAPESIQRLATAAKNGPTAMMTSMDMGSIRSLLAAEFTTEDRWPGDIAGFCRANVRGVDHPDQDRWGNPYRLTPEPGNAVLASCGPDQSCGTEDDMVMKVLAKKKGPERSADIESQ